MNRDAAGTNPDASTDSLSQAPPDCARRAAVRCAAAVAALIALGASAFALAVDSDNIYEAYTDAKLSEIASDWQSLTTEERRDYFIEVRRRMAEAGKKRAGPPVRIVGERRFGRIISQPDGSVLRIEGVVSYRGRDTTQTETPPDYGTGFEQRVEQTAERGQGPSVTAPVVTVVNENGVGQTEFVTEQDDLETTTGEREQGAQRRE